MYNISHVGDTASTHMLSLYRSFANITNVIHVRRRGPLSLYYQGERQALGMLFIELHWIRCARVPHWSPVRSLGYQRASYQPRPVFGVIHEPRSVALNLQAILYLPLTLTP